MRPDRGGRVGPAHALVQREAEVEGRLWMPSGHFDLNLLLARVLLFEKAEKFISN